MPYDHMDEHAGFLSASGYVTTGAMANSVPDTLKAAREVGTDRVFESRVEQTTGNGLSPVAERFGSVGFVITALTANSAPYTLFATSVSDLRSSSTRPSRCRCGIPTTQTCA